MPEGHTIHQIARAHRRLLRGRRLAVTSPQGRFAAGAARLDGDVLDDVEAFGKHLFYRWHRGSVLHVHLGLFGCFTLHRGTRAPVAMGALRLRMIADGDDGRPRLTLDLRGPTDCSVISPAERETIIDRLGPDPLRADADPVRFVARVARTDRAIGALLIDQSVIAGLGNVYRAEVLFHCGIGPRRPGRSLDDAETRCLWDTATSMLRKGVRDRRIVTVDPSELEVLVGPQAHRGESTYAYHRDPGLRCGSAIERFELGIACAMRARSASAERQDRHSAERCTAVRATRPGRRLSGHPAATCAILRSLAVSPPRTPNTNGWSSSSTAASSAHCCLTPQPEQLFTAIACDIGSLGVNSVPCPRQAAKRRQLGTTTRASRLIGPWRRGAASWSTPRGDRHAARDAAAPPPTRRSARRWPGCAGLGFATPRGGCHSAAQPGRLDQAGVTLGAAAA
jgi:endonuclease VIII